MAEENTTPEGLIPPKQSPVTPGSPAAGEAPRKPVFMKKPLLRKPGETISAPAVPVPPPAAATPPPPAGITQGIPISREMAAKKMTARINLATATQAIPAVMAQTEVPPAPDSEPKTIKLRAPSAPAPVQPNAPSAEEAPAVQAQAAKSKTSRISLETALSDQPDLPAPAAPKTIRLKRPTEMGGAPKPQLKPPTTHVTIPPSPAQPAPSVAVATPPPEPQADADNAVTRKKTIKVKRPGAAGAGPKITLNKEEGTADAGDNLQALSAMDSLAPAAKPDKVNPIFIIAAVIGILVVINLIWVFAAQLYGPNAAAADFATLQGPTLPNPIGAMVVE